MFPKPSSTAPSTAPTGNKKKEGTSHPFTEFSLRWEAEMARLRRFVVPGLPHHITQRGNRRANVFLDDQDRRVFLRLLRETSERYSLGRRHDRKGRPAYRVGICRKAPLVESRATRPSPVLCTPVLHNRRRTGADPIPAGHVSLANMCHAHSCRSATTGSTRAARRAGK